MNAHWTPAAALNDLHEGEPQLFTRDRTRVALFRVDGEIFAIDDRCPHEGYPLTQGSLCGTTLTCCFHNFKFNLRDGACTLGRFATAAARVLCDVGTDDNRLTASAIQRQVPNRAFHAVHTAEAGVFEFRYFTASCDGRFTAGDKGLVHHAFDDDCPGRIVGTRLGSQP